MTQEDIAAACGGEVKVPVPDGAQINDAYTSDMLSDVMAGAPENSVLITIQNHLNTIAVCTLVGIRVVLVCQGRPVPDDMAAAAEEEGVGIISAPMSQFAASVAIGKLLGQ